MADTTSFWKGGSRKEPARGVIMAGFGKHPAWAEHKQGLGELSEPLTDLRGRLYWDGILKLLPAWKTLPLDSRCEFNHWLVWFQCARIVLGRIVASSDKAGRDEVPFIVLMEVNGHPLGWALRQLASRLDEFTHRCLGLSSPEVVRTAFITQQSVFESLVSNGSTADVGNTPTAQERAAFSSGAGLDSQGLGLARLLYKVELGWAPFLPLRGGKAPKPQAGFGLRAPGVAGELTASVLMWEEFAAQRVHADVTRTYLVPDVHNWLDVVVGQLEGSHFFGLQANEKRVALETEVPHVVTPELQARARATMVSWLAGDSMGKTGATDKTASVCAPPASSSAGPPRGSTEAKTPAGGEESGSRKAWVVVLALVLLASSALVYHPGQWRRLMLWQTLRPHASQNPTQVGSQGTTTAPQRPATAQIDDYRKPAERDSVLAIGQPAPTSRIDQARVPSPALARTNSAPEELITLNLELDAFKVWFGLAQPGDSGIRNPAGYPGEGEVAKPLSTELSIPPRKLYREKATELRRRFQAAGLMSPKLEETFRLLDERIEPRH